MKPEYQEYLKRMSCFNEWEDRFRGQLTVEENLDQFLILYGLGDFVPENISKKIHTEHVETLCQTQKRLKETYESH